MKIHWFSPLPPARTAIAQYTLGILPALEQHFELVLWTDQGEWSPDLENRVEVERYRPEQFPWAELNRDGISIYHIGNNHLFHSSIWEVSCRHPGLVVLHDLCLHDFFINVYRDRDDYKGYLTQMEHYYGSSGRKFAETIWEGTFPPGYGVADYPLTRLALENALAVLVHTREAFDALRQENRRPAAFAPLPYAGASVWTEKEKDKFPYRLILFGHIGYNRRCEAVLQALATFPDNECFRLDIYGQVWNIPDLYSRISDLDLEGKVIIHGFVSDAELQSALASAHLALNLRYPTMGESSFSQLQIWEHALPSLVTPVGWYAELSRDTVAFVRPDQEVSDIKEHLKAFLDDPKKFAQMGRNGRRQLEEQHSPTRYVQVLKDLVHQARNFEAIATAHSLAERVGSETSLWLDSDASAEVFRGVAKQILSICSNRS